MIKTTMFVLGAFAAGAYVGGLLLHPTTVKAQGGLHVYTQEMPMLGGKDVTLRGARLVGFSCTARNDPPSTCYFASTD